MGFNSQTTYTITAGSGIVTTPVDLLSMDTIVLEVSGGAQTLSAPFSFDVTGTIPDGITYKVEYDGGTTIQLFADEAPVATMTGITVPAAELAVGFGYINGAAGAETTDVDYILVVKER